MFSPLVPLSLLVSSIAAGMMMLLLLVVLLLVMCMVGRRKRRTAERHGAPILSQCLCPPGHTFPLS